MRGKSSGFSLVELLVSTAVLLITMLILFLITDQTGKLWKQTSGRIDAFRQVRGAFDSIIRRVSEATLNTYWDYEYVDPNAAIKVPKRYIRQSELRFLTGPASTLVDLSAQNQVSTGHAMFFHAPIGFSESGPKYEGMETLLNTCGYFVACGSDADLRPAFLTTPAASRFRVFEFIEPSEKLSIYDQITSDPKYTGKNWFQDSIRQGNHHRIIAENLITLVILPRLSPSDETAKRAVLSPDYVYDSTVASGKAETNWRNQLPPEVQVTAVAIDEPSGARLSREEPNPVQALSLDQLFKKAAASDTDIDYADYNSDLQKLQDELVRRHFNFRVFTATVSIKAAKWSTDQKN